MIRLLSRLLLVLAFLASPVNAGMLVNSYVFGVPGNDSFTKILLHMDGADASTTFTDSNLGGSAHTWTAHGNAQIDTAIAKFSTGSGLYDGTGDYVDTPDSTDFTLGSGDWTVDFWFNTNGSGNGTTRRIFGQSNSNNLVDSSAMQGTLTSANAIDVRANVSTTAFAVTSSTTFTSAGWHHVAFIRTSNTLKLFIDGAQEGGDVAITGSVNNVPDKFAVGRRGEVTGSEFLGSLDEFRLSVGVARWTANFTPPAGPYN